MNRHTALAKRLTVFSFLAMGIVACGERPAPATESPAPAKAEAEILDDEIIRNPEPFIAAALKKTPHLQAGETVAKVAKITYQGPGQVIVGTARAPSYIVKIPTWIVEAESDKGRRYTIEYTIQPDTPVDRLGAARLAEQPKR